MIRGPIAVVAPSGAYQVQKYEAGLEIASAAGFDLRPFPDMLQPHRYLASSDEHRLEQLVNALRSPEFAAVWLVRGGYGITRLLSKLPSDLPAKPVIGFSDTTALFAALPAAFPRVHGAMLHSLPATDNPSREELFHWMRTGESPTLQGEPWIAGVAEGRLCGGNLAMFASLAGTPFQAHTQGTILLLEDIGEAPYRIDRMIQQLLDSGFFAGVRGVGFGEFSGCHPPDGTTWSLKEVLLDQIGRLGIPVVGNLPFGHGSANRPFVWGQPARLAEGRITPIQNNAPRSST